MSGPGRLGMMRLLETDPAGLVVVSTDDEILFANPKAADLLGVGRDMLTGADFRFFVPSSEQYVALMAAFQRGDEPRLVELELRRAGGPNFRARVNWTDSRFNDRDAYVLWIEDVTARRLVEETLSQLFDAAPLPMILCAYQNGEVRRANRRAVELFIIGRKLSSCHLDDILGTDTARRFFRKLRESGGFVDDFEAMLLTAYGEAFAGTLSGQMITIDDERHILVGMNDITDRKKAEETLRRFFDAGPLAMLLARLADTTVIRINRRASELFTSNDGGGRDTHTLERYLGPQAAQEFLNLLSEGGFVDSFEARLTTDYGESFWAIISGQVVDIEDERCVLVGVTDIADRKRAEEELSEAKDVAEDATRAKSLFLATMSHEIRTPMNGVLGMLDMLNRTGLSAEQKEMVEIIGHSASTLLTIIDDILDLSKIEAGKLQLEHVGLRLREIVEVAVELVAPRARDRGLELAWWADPALEDSFFGDPVRLRQILLNLLTNAVKFTEQGHITVRIHGMERFDHATLVRVEVTDTGIGLNPEQRDRLFKAYSQAEASTTRHFGGTGLGLSICQRLTVMMGGHIGVVSSPGVGSTFWFELPLATGPDLPPAVADQLHDVAILVVDDLPEARGQIAITLRNAGATVNDVSDVVAALELLSDGVKFDLAIVDLPDCLPELLEPLAKAVGRSRIVPTTPVASDAAARWCLDQGVQPPLVKPTRAGTLIRAVNQTIGRMSEVAADSKRPLAVPARAGKAPTIEEALAAGRLILVAEDNAVNRLVIGKQLTELGYAFETSNDGEAAWEMLQQKRYGLLLTDCFMPRLDGYDLTRRIRRKEAQEGGRLPVVALTANVLEGEAEKCYAASMDDYLSKPVFLDRLAAALERWLPAVANPEADDSATPDEAPAAVAAAAEPDEEPPISLENFAEILGTDDPDTLREILAFFVETFTQSLAALHQALAARDRPSLRNAAHAAKGAARNACASLLAAGLEELEHKALTREPFNRLAERVEAAEKAFASVRAMVDKL